MTETEEHSGSRSKAPTRCEPKKLFHLLADTWITLWWGKLGAIPTATDYKDGTKRRELR